MKEDLSPAVRWEESIERLRLDVRALFERGDTPLSAEVREDLTVMIRYTKPVGEIER